MPVDCGEGFTALESAASGVEGRDGRASAAPFVLAPREEEARPVDPFVSGIGVLVRPVDVDVSDFSLLGAGAVITSSSKSESSGMIITF